MGNHQAQSMAAAVNATDEEELRTCFSTLTGEEKARLQATILELKTPRESARGVQSARVPQSARGLPAKKDEEINKEPAKVDEPTKADESAKTEDSPKAEEAGKAAEPAKKEEPANVSEPAKAEEPKKQELSASGPKKEEPAKAEEEAEAPASDDEGEDEKIVLTDVQIANVRKGFQASDRDNSGVIEANELKIIMKALDVDMTNEDVMVVLNNVDVNGNGAIGFDLFLTLVAESLTNYAKACS